MKISANTNNKIYYKTFANKLKISNRNNKDRFLVRCFHLTKNDQYLSSLSYFQKYLIVNIA